MYIRGTERKAGGGYHGKFETVDLFFRRRLCHFCLLVVSKENEERGRDENEYKT